MVLIKLTEEEKKKQNKKRTKSLADAIKKANTDASTNARAKGAKTQKEKINEDLRKTIDSFKAVQGNVKQVNAMREKAFNMYRDKNRTLDAVTRVMLTNKNGIDDAPIKTFIQSQLPEQTKDYEAFKANLKERAAITNELAKYGMNQPIPEDLKIKANKKGIDVKDYKNPLIRSDLSFLQSVGRSALKAAEAVGTSRPDSVFGGYAQLRKTEKEEIEKQRMIKLEEEKTTYERGQDKKLIKLKNKALDYQKQQLDNNKLSNERDRRQRKKLATDKMMLDFYTDIANMEGTNIAAEKLYSIRKMLDDNYKDMNVILEDFSDKDYEDFWKEYETESEFILGMQEFEGRANLTAAYRKAAAHYAGLDDVEGNETYNEKDSVLETIKSRKEKERDVRIKARKLSNQIFKKQIAFFTANKNERELLEKEIKQHREEINKLFGTENEMTKEDKERIRATYAYKDIPKVPPGTILNRPQSTLFAALKEAVLSFRGIPSNTLENMSDAVLGKRRVIAQDILDVINIDPATQIGKTYQKMIAGLADFALDPLYLVLGMKLATHKKTALITKLLKGGDPVKLLGKGWNRQKLLTGKAQKLLETAKFGKAQDVIYSSGNAPKIIKLLKGRAPQKLIETAKFGKAQDVIYSSGNVPKIIKLLKGRAPQKLIEAAKFGKAKKVIYAGKYSPSTEKLLNKLNQYGISNKEWLKGLF